MVKKVLVCGSTGFIGRNIATALSNRDEFEVYGTYHTSTPFDWAGVRMVSADLTDKADVDRVVKGMDIIVQAAATTSGVKDIVTKPYHHVTDNAVMNSLTFRSAYEQNVSHVVFFSCTVMYGSSDVPVREIDFDANAQMYKNYFGVGWTKVYIEKMCEFYSRISDTRYTAIRHSNVFGPHDKFDLERSHVFGATLTKVMTADNPGTVVVWGSGEEERDLLYVDDLVDFVELAIEKQTEPFGLYNVGSGSSISIGGLVEKIIKHSGKDLKIKYDLEKPTIKTRLRLDISKAAGSFGWSPKTSLDEGIEKTIEWYGANI